MTARHVRAMMKEGYYSRRREPVVEDVTWPMLLDSKEATVTEY